LSVERACTTAMMSVHIAAMNVQCGLGDVYIAGGLDSMTHFRIPMIKDGMDMDAIIKEGGHMLATMNPNPKMMARINPIELNGGQGAELLCDRYGITRQDLDRWALLSHQRAVAETSGRLRKIELLASLLTFRVLYFMLPFCAAVLLLSAREGWLAARVSAGKACAAAAKDRQLS
jgi:acetyl-CoA C-acetyltransferase